MRSEPCDTPPLSLTSGHRDFDIGDSVGCLRYYAGWADKIVGQVRLPVLLLASVVASPSAPHRFPFGKFLITPSRASSFACPAKTHTDVTSRASTSTRRPSLRSQSTTPSGFAAKCACLFPDFRQNSQLKTRFCQHSMELPDNDVVRVMKHLGASPQRDIRTLQGLEGRPRAGVWLHHRHEA